MGRFSEPPVPKGYFRAYRAVGQAEFDQITRTGKLEPDPRGGMEGKFFFGNIQDTAAWAVKDKGPEHGGKRYYIIQYNVPHDNPNIKYWGGTKPDGFKDGIYIPKDELNK